MQSAPRILKEAFLALALIAVGLFLLPAMIYLVGQLLVGEYDGGMGAFYLALADSLSTGNAFAWLLIASPYLIVQLLRLWLRLGRRRQKNATQVTQSVTQQDA